MKRGLLFFVLLFSSWTLCAESIKEMVFFGDSLSDNGNLYHYLRIIPKSPPYYEGQFSNGPVWAERIRAIYPALSYANYAVGGATVKLHGPLQDSLPIDLHEEIQDYLLRTRSTDRSHTLFSVWIGANDYLVSDNENLDQVTTQVVNATFDSIDHLIKNGANYFMLMDLPDLSKVPYYSIQRPEQVQRASILSQLHHEKTIAAINQFKLKYPDKLFIYIDAYSIFSDILVNLETYNEHYHTMLKDSYHSCWQGGYTLNSAQLSSTPAFVRYIKPAPALLETYRVSYADRSTETPCDNPDEYLFWDSVHPTAVMHDIFSQIVAARLAESGVVS